MAKKKAIKVQDRAVEMVTCLTCSKAELLQWDKDPIIACCKERNVREVAAVRRSCALYEASRVLPRPIKHIKKYAG